MPRPWKTVQQNIPLDASLCKTITVPNGFRDISCEKLFSGQLPTRVVVGLVTNQAFNGHRERNLFNFQHFSVTEISLYLDGQQQDGIKPMELNYANSHYIQAYNTLFSGTGKICREKAYPSIVTTTLTAMRCTRSISRPIWETKKTSM